MPTRLITIHITFSNASHRNTFADVTNTYQKGDLFCVSVYALPESDTRTIYKFPLANIFSIEEEHPI